MDFQYFDSHCHVQGSEYDTDRDDLLTALAKSKIGMTVVGVDREASQSAVALAEKHENIFAAVGQHPTDTNEPFVMSAFEILAKNPRTVAIGECGLDYFRADNHDTARATQIPLLESQIALAVSVNKPLMIHARPSKGTMDAYSEIIDVLKSAKREHGDMLIGNIHFFVGGIEEARAFLEMDFTISYTAVITFASDYDETIRYMPLRSILSETDSPYVSPAPNRGKRNSPFAVVDVVQAIARIRGENEETIRQAMIENAVRVFNL